MGSAGGGCIAGAALACTGVGTVASSTGAGVAFGSIGGGLVATPGGRAVFFFADAVAGELSSVTSALATGLCASGEATGSASAVGVCWPVPLGVAVDPGGHVIQHSAAAGNDRTPNPLTAVKLTRRRDVVFMFSPPLLLLYSTPLCGRASSTRATPCLGATRTLRA